MTARRDGGDVVIFLDCDGVLQRWDAYTAANRFPVDPLIAERLRCFCEEVRGEVVVSSTWRKIMAPGAFCALFQPWMKNHLSRRWSTGIRADGKRGREIQDWLDAHGAGRPYVCFDDDIQDYAGTEPVQHLIRTDRTVGLTDQDILGARIILDAQLLPVKP